MTSARRQTVLFLMCAIVLLAAGFATGYVYSYDGFYSAEAQIDHELLEMDFNSRQLYLANVGRNSDCQRELVRQLRGQVAFINKLLSTAPRKMDRRMVDMSIAQAQSVMVGQPITVKH